MAISKPQEDKLEAIYVKLPTIECKGLCHGCCGPVAMTRLEWKRLKSFVGKTNKQIGPCKGKEGLTCPLLTDEKRCSAYSVRPLICRLWGLVKEMKCPHGCEPTRWLPDAEARQIINEMEEAGK